MNDLTQQGVVALKSGNKIRARNLLKAALRQDPLDVDAWLWLSGAVDSDAERIDCLQNVLRLDPHNRAAAKGYTHLTGREWVVEEPAGGAVPPPAMVPMGEGAPPAILEPLREAADEIAPAPPEEPQVDEKILHEFPAAAEEAAAAAAESIEAQVPETPVVEPAETAEPKDEPAEYEAPGAAAEEEPRIKSWEELLGPSEADEPPDEVIEEAEEEEVSDTQELRVGKSRSGLLFVTGPSLGYGLFKLLLLLAFFAGITAVAYYYLVSIPVLYIIIFAIFLALNWLVLFLITILGSSSNRYTLTKNKLLIEYGLTGKKKTGLPLDEIEDVTAHQSFLQKILGVGDILVKTKAGDQGWRLKDLARFQQRLQEIENAML